ncbi:MAG: DUF309 domain-containing protein [Halobacteriaceae archaeon]
MEAHLRAGAAVFDAGHHHAAHDAWEERWLELEAGDDERLLHGLIQYAAVAHHADEGNWEGVRGLATSAAEYLGPLPADYWGVNVGEVSAYLRRVAADPEHAERAPPPPLRVDGEAPALADLDPAAAFVAAPVVAEAVGLDPDPVEAGVEYARTDLAAGEEGSRFLRLALDFVGDADHRGVIHQRLAGHVSRRRAKEEDVEGLFD